MKPNETSSAFGAARVFSGIFEAFRLVIRPWMGPPACRFTPTCSRYAQEALSRKGWSGALLTLRRLARCHPFHPGGFDPVP